MKIIQIDLNKDFIEELKEVVSVLNSGGVIIYPTDTLYGIGGNALDEDVVRRVFEIKERSFSKPLPMIVRNIEWAKELAHVSKKNEEILNKIWPWNLGIAPVHILPGKITAVLPKKDIVPNLLTAGQPTIGMRVPDYPLLDSLLKLFGYPIISTSANISGQESTNDIDKIIGVFSKRLTKQPDLVLDVGILPKSEPSTILDLTTGRPKILRVGPSRPDQLLKLLNI